MIDFDIFEKEKKNRNMSIYVLDDTVWFEITNCAEVSHFTINIEELKQINDKLNNFFENQKITLVP